MSPFYQAIRLISKRPGFALAVGLTLALGIGANTTVFSLINSVVLRPLPYPDSGRLYTLFEQDSLRSARQVTSYPTFRDWHEQSTAFDGLAFIRGTGLTYHFGQQSGFVLAAFVSEDFFPTLDTPAAVGRSVIAADYREENAVAVLSHRTWERSFGGDTTVVGQTVTLANAPYVIVGVMPPEFTYPNWGMAESDVWLPITAVPSPDQAALDQRDFHADSRVVARLRSDVPYATAQGEMDAIARRLAHAYPAASGAWTHVSIEPVKDFMLGDVPSQLFLFAAAVAFVLLICCVNLANLYLAQGAGRSREFAIRAALGASRTRVVRQLLLETSIVAVSGGALGVVFIHALEARDFSRRL